MKRLIIFTLLFSIPLVSLTIASQKDTKLKSETFTGLAFRGIGPALMAGRIADIAIHPKRQSTWYVAVGSGGVWKTINSGTTWEPIFDNEVSYSIGCVAIDPNNPEVVWVGTGENVSGRHVGYGDGIYKSLNGGKTWTNAGLRKSEHISKILIDPRNSTGTERKGKPGRCLLYSAKSAVRSNFHLQFKRVAQNQQSNEKRERK